ncbi:uncharacterized protein TRUGW13939_10328 [Talaromyces rugulosus]|uniref:Alcohol dehydrogenase-like N-terminal domain-containing protein n=1 Tax=Talaromyces rugulosus TaxID=121627 RepID=A0A7H8R9Q6_TALRU|nr:uncharacterized protein TRUGW13939_10328 [Talaromyces rugulosus]QKX63159.1 hypothetical protein TRUGW13939_10328 [Talaromyces rugulosus]
MAGTPQMQTAMIQSQIAEYPGSLPLTASAAEQVPALASPYHVLVRILSVALNPNDHKMVTNFPRPGYGAGCDFCGIVERLGNLTGDSKEDTDLDLVRQLGTRVCGTVFPYAPVDAGINTLAYRTGAFAEFVAVDALLLLRAPSSWTELQGAALGGVGWSTVALAMSARDALALPGLPSMPAEKKVPILVYGGGTATGTMAAQLLNLQYGSLYTGTNLSECLDTIRALTADGPPLRHALDCITDADSASLCFGALARTGGRYACLEGFREAWRTRRVVVKEVMGYEMLGRPVDLGGLESTYTRGVIEAAIEIGRRWAGEMQRLLDGGLIQAHPIQEIVPEKGEGSQKESWVAAITSGLHMLMAGGIKGRKLVVRVSSVESG